MAEPTGTVHALRPAKKRTRTTRQTKKKPVDIPALVVAGEPVLTAGMDLLENVGKLKPYVSALRLLATTGQVYFANAAQRKTIDKIKKQRKKLARMGTQSASYPAELGKLYDLIDQL